MNWNITQIGNQLQYEQLDSTVQKQIYGQINEILVYGHKKSIFEPKLQFETNNIYKATFQDVSFDISYLQTFKNLRSLHLSRVDCDDITNNQLIILQLFKCKVTPTTFNSLNLTNIDISETNIQNLHFTIPLQYLQALSITESSLSSLSGIQNHKYLKKLTIQNTKIQNLDYLQDLPLLLFLDLQNNKQFIEFGSIKNIQSLRSIDLQYTAIESLIGLDQITNLEIIDLSFTDIQSFIGVKNLVRLQKICANETQLTSFMGLQNIPRIQEIQIKNCKKFCSFESKKQIDNVKVIDASWTSVTSFEGLENCYLDSLDLQYCEKFIGGNTSPQQILSLNIQNTSFALLRNIINTNVQTLNIHGASVKQFQEMKLMNVNNVIISSEKIKYMIRNDNAYSVQQLNVMLVDNSISDLDRLVNLQQLQISGKLQSLSSFSNLLNLTYLDIQKCKNIYSFASLHNLPNLKYINANRSGITSIEHILQFPVLKELNIQRCNIKNLAVLNDIHLDELAIDDDMLIDPNQNINFKISPKTHLNMLVQNEYVPNCVSSLEFDRIKVTGQIQSICNLTNVKELIVDGEYVEQLNLVNQNITKLSINNTSISNLQGLYIPNITNINVSNNQYLTQLSGIEQLIYLVSIDAHNCKISNMTVFNKLEYLDISNNPLITLSVQCVDNLNISNTPLQQIQYSNIRSIKAENCDQMLLESITVQHMSIDVSNISQKYNTQQLSILNCVDTNQMDQINDNIQNIVLSGSIQFLNIRNIFSLDVSKCFNLINFNQIICNCKRLIWPQLSELHSIDIQQLKIIELKLGNSDYELYKQPGGAKILIKIRSNRSIYNQIEYSNKIKQLKQNIECNKIIIQKIGKVLLNINFSAGSE
ncbi:Leucine_rich repeats-containing protein [Hexamita inflata]|uniref:Leucine rich repeats-containing protein n=1 Tax=Hexamita inflata TaxID=28002 RepID=A0AA86NTA3_9EUKA|nr:Leucine rich repeats-containing protein [Hexamita inflata]